MVEYTDVLEGIVYEPTQSESPGFDLTVAEIREFSAPGRVDFGGDELEPAATTPHPSEKRNPEDEYEWWHLDAGQYLLEYNESVAREDVTLTIQTRDELLARGAFHPTVHVSSLPQIPLSVGGSGLRIKENARVSTIVDVEGV